MGRQALRTLSGLVLLLGHAFGLAADEPVARLSSPAAPVTENTGPNTVILRRASGTYRYESISDARLRGEERWQFFAYADGSRMLLMWHDLFARNAQFTALLRTAETFRPLEAFVSYWNGGAFKGSAHFRVDGLTLHADSAGPYGVRSQTIRVPERFSIGTHPVAGDGWHTWTGDDKVKGVQHGTSYGLEASADLTKPILGSLAPLELEFLGEGAVEVPAGRFAVRHVRLAGMNDLWITRQDRLVIKSVIAARDLQYVLIRAEGDFK